MYQDEVAEWLRRWTANPMGSARVGSNPILVVKIFFDSVRKCEKSTRKTALPLTHVKVYKLLIIDLD